MNWLPGSPQTLCSAQPFLYPSYFDPLPYDVHAQCCLVGQIRKRKAARDITACFAQLRSCYPKHIRIYVVMDNFRANVQAVNDFFPGKNMVAVYTSTNASWLNAIESQFKHLHNYALKNSNDRDHLSRRRRIYRYLRWHNRQRSVTRVKGQLDADKCEGVVLPGVH